jgi:diaminopimelate decarboxylase
MNTKQLFAPTCTEISGIPISELSKTFGTPTYIYDAQTIRDRIAQLHQFDVVRYAQKANSNIAILNLMRLQGVVVDAVSTGEVHRAQKAGFNVSQTPHQVIYTADIFDRAALDLVVEHNIPVNCGSPDMIRQLGTVAPGREITLRINPGFGHGHSAKTNTGGDTSKHGIWHEQLDQCLTIAKEHNLTVSGLHMHIGSGTDFKHLSQVCDAMKATALKVGASITTISAGGGLPTPYRDTDVSIDIDRYFQLWDGVRKQLETEFGHAITLEIEPGRFLVAESGYLLTEIRAIKNMGEKLYYLVDAGFNNLARPILYGAYHPMAIAFAGEPTADFQDVIVGGPLCESGDIFTQEEGGFVCSRELPVANVGDYLVIQCAGAYGFVMSSNYNSKPMAAEVLIDNGEVHLIRRQQTNDELLAGETIPF